MNEPSLLDYIKEKLDLRRLLGKKTPEVSVMESEPQDEGQEPQPDQPVNQISILERLPWRSLLAVVLAFVAQRNLEPETRNFKIGIIFYLAAAALLILALVKNEWKVAPQQAQSEAPGNFTFHKFSSLIIIPIFLLSFFAFSGNKFTSLNITIWVVLIIAALIAFWTPSGRHRLSEVWQRIKDFMHHPGIHLSFTWWEVLLLAVFALAGFFRLYQLNSVPVEMISDHAEKLLDVTDVLDGETSIFFYRNTGREAFQFYLTALVSKVFGTGISFMSLKLGTALMGLVTLIYVYRLGKELGNRWVGLLAVLLMGMAYWPNIGARIGLRFALYPLFVAPLMFYLIRGLRRMDRNDFILAGIALGLGLHGYSPYRIVPFLVAAAVLIFIIHIKGSVNRKTAIWGFVLVAFFSLVIFLPLARFWTENPTMFGMRAFSRLASTERAIQGPVILVFLSNFWNASIMPFWDNGNVWAHSIPYRPALDVISAGLYLLGVIALLYRYLRQRKWQDLVLLVSIPVLMLPSILSLAFPEENPALNRTAGAEVPIFIVAAIALEGFLAALWQKARALTGKLVVAILGLVLVGISASQNYDLVFKQYAPMYAASSWNTSQIGAVVRDYVNSTGSVDSVWVVGIAHWVDTRLVGINSGFPTEDYAIWPEDFATTVDVPAPKLFIVRADDQADIDLLKFYYPTGYLILHQNLTEGKRFLFLCCSPCGTVTEPGELTGKAQVVLVPVSPVEDLNELHRFSVL